MDRSCETAPLMEAQTTVIGPRGWAARREAARRPGWAVPAFVCGCMLVALALRLADLHWSLTGDELFAYDDIRGRSLGSMLHYLGHNSESSPPLFFILAWLAAHLGDAPTLIRLPSIILGAATVPVVYALARRCVGRPAALLAAALFAIDPFAVWQGGEARPYGMLMFTTALCALVLVVALDAKPWSGWWAAYAASAASVVYTHYTGAFVLAAQTLWALWVMPARRRELVAASVGGAVLYLPWWPSYHGSWLGVYSALDVPLVPSRIGQTFLQGLVGHPAFASLRAFPGLVATILFLVVVGAGLAAAVAGRRRGTAGARPVLIVTLALATPVGILLYSAFSYDLLLVRNLAASLPFALITVAWLVTALRRLGPAPGLAAAAAVCGVYGLGAIKSLAPSEARADFRGALAWVNARSRPGDTLLDSSLIPALDGYQRTVPSYIHGAYTLSTPGTPAASAGWSRAQDGNRVFVLVERAGLLEHYRPPRFDGADRSCQTATASRAACLPLRASHTFDGLQQLVVAEYGQP